MAIINGGNSADVLNGTVDADIINAFGGDDVIVAGAGDTVDGGAGNDTLVLQTLSAGGLLGAVFRDLDVFAGPAATITLPGGESVTVQAVETIVLGATTISRPVIRADVDPVQIVLDITRDTDINAVTLIPRDFNNIKEQGDTVRDGYANTTDLARGNGAGTLTVSRGDNSTLSPSSMQFLENGFIRLDAGSQNPTLTSPRRDNGNVVFRGYENSPRVSPPFGDSEDSRVSNFFVFQFQGPTINGNGGANRLIGYDTRDNINGGGGDDTIFGGFGNDTIRGDAGADQIDGNRHNDLIFGGAGADTITGGQGADVIDGEDGDDVIDAGNDNDFVNGGVGRDVIQGGAGADTLNGDGGDDTLRGGAGGDQINGGDGADLIVGGDGGDMLNGDGGDDVFYGQAGDDTVNGGEGDDVAVYGGSLADYTVRVSQSTGEFEVIALAGDEGTDVLSGVERVQFSNGIFVLADVAEPSQIDVVDGPTGNRLVGTDGDDTIDGAGGDDTIAGRGGDDVLIGGPGADVIDGEGGEDVVSGGHGADDIDGGDGADILRGGDDGDAIDGDGGDDAIFGENGDDNLSGGDGEDDIHGGDGADTISGDRGDDEIDGGGGDDVATFAENRGAYRITFADDGRISVADRTADRGGVDLLRNIETLRFADGDIEVDAPLPVTTNLTAAQVVLPGVAADYRIAPEPSLGNVFVATNLSDVFQQPVAIGADQQAVFADSVVNFVGDSEAGPNFYQSDIRIFPFVNFAGAFDTYLRPDTEARHNSDDVIRFVIPDNTTFQWVFEDQGVKGVSTIRGLRPDFNLTWFFRGYDEVVIQGRDGGAVRSFVFANERSFSFRGDSGANVIQGGDTSNRINAGAGDDSVEGGFGFDILNGEDGDDVLDGGRHADTINGGSGDDKAFGAHGDDLIRGDAGQDSLFGGVGDDTIEGGDGFDLLFGDAGDDSLDGGAGFDVAYGGAGDDTITVGQGDVAIGGAGDDVIAASGVTAGGAPIMVRFVGVASEYAVTVDGADFVVADAVTDRDGADRIAGAPAEAVFLEFGDGALTSLADLLAPSLKAADDAFAVREDARLFGDLFADNGEGPDEGVGVAITGVGDNGAVGEMVTLASGATVTVEADGTFAYAQNGAFDSLGAGETATDGFTYTVGDPDGRAAVGAVTITVNGDIERLEVVQGSARLQGGAASETIVAGGQRLQVAAGGSGSDVFDFSGVVGDSVRQTNYVMDYEVGLDLIDIGGAEINGERAVGSRLLLSVGPENDMLVIIGASSSEELEFL